MCAEAGSIEQFGSDEEGYDLAEDIIKFYAKYNVRISIPWWQYLNSRFIFKVKLKGNTRESHVRANALDVQNRLKLPVFYVMKYDFNLFLIASREKIEHDRLPAILKTSDYQKAQLEKQLPYLVGHNVIGRMVMDDLAPCPHLLMGGSTNSGKSVGLQALITCVSFSKSPSQVNFILIDVGATDLMPFDGLPHLLCPVIRDRVTAVRTLKALTIEMERRIELEHTDPAGFERLPRLMVVIDEFPALFTGVDKAVSKALTDSISALLQRGRHAKIHVVLAAQNPTYQNMKVDLGNITVRIAFKCAKRNFSETILGEGGAENLAGQGDLLLRSPRYDVPERIQGIYITPEELREAVQYIKSYYGDAVSRKFNLVFPSNGPVKPSAASGDNSTRPAVGWWVSKDDLQIADAMLWALGHNSISINMLMKERRIGWNTASRLVERLEFLGIVSRPKGKLPRAVIPNRPEALPEEAIELLHDADISQGAVEDAFYSR